MQHPAGELQIIELVVVCHRDTISHSTLYKKDVFKKKRTFDSSLHLSCEAARHWQKALSGTQEGLGE